MKFPMLSTFTYSTSNNRISGRYQLMKSPYGTWPIGERARLGPFNGPTLLEPMRYSLVEWSNKNYKQ